MKQIIKPIDLKSGLIIIIHLLSPNFILLITFGDMEKQEIY
jgi:hypothetical protein